jgi:hypothetical protein
MVASRLGFGLPCGDWWALDSVPDEGAMSCTCFCLQSLSLVVSVSSSAGPSCDGGALGSGLLCDWWALGSGPDEGARLCPSLLGCSDEEGFQILPWLTVCFLL